MKGNTERAREARAIIRDLIRCCTEDTIPAYYQGTVKRAQRFLDQEQSS